LHASIPESVTGPVELAVELAGPAGVDSVKGLLSTWSRAVEVGFFGEAEVRLTYDSRSRSTLVDAELGCNGLPLGALYALQRVLQHFSGTAHRIASATFRRNGSVLSLGDVAGAALVQLPDSIPFPVAYPHDLHAGVRVEIEFRSALSAGHQHAIAAAFSIWDLLVVALGRTDEWGKRVDRETRRMSPTSIEHEVVGYFSGFECLDLVVLMGLKLHQRLPIEQMTLES
jgi:hypothetical protein